MKNLAPVSQFVAGICRCFVALILVPLITDCRGEDKLFTKITVADLGIAFESPNSWFKVDALGTQKLYQALELVLGEFNKSRVLLHMISQEDIYSPTSSTITVQFEPDNSISQQQIKDASGATLNILLDEVRDATVEVMRQLTNKRLAVSSSVTKERIVKRTSGAVFLGVELAVKMRADVPEKRKEVYYMFSDKGTILLAFTYLAANSANMSKVRDHILESFELSVRNTGADVDN